MHKIFSILSAESRTKRIVGFLTNSFGKIDNRLLIFLLLCLNYLSFKLTSNEEAYLPMAKQFMDPLWMPNSFSFNEWPGNRLIFQFIAGTALKYMTFEQVAFIGRLVVFMVIAFPVGKLFKLLHVNNLPAILLFQIYLIKQSFFAGEFIFKDFEPKSLAYIFVLTGLNCLLEGKYNIAALWSVLAAYLHILVGSWFFLVVLLFTWISTRKAGTLVRQLLLFSILLTPIFLYLAKEIFKDGSIINGINIDQVYVYFRNPHHLAPLSVKGYLPRTIFHISIAGLLFLLTLFFFSKEKGSDFDALYNLNVIIFTILFVSLGISLFDHNGKFLKFYPFRLAALGSFLMYIYIFKWVALKWSPPETMKLVLILIGFCILSVISGHTLRKFIYPVKKPEFEELVKFITQNSKKTDVFLTMEDYDLSLSRQTDRAVFVNFKFDPGGGKKIYDWYWRIVALKKLNSNIGYLNDILKKYKLDYVLSNHALPPTERLEPVFGNSSYCLYKIQ